MDPQTKEQQQKLISKIQDIDGIVIKSSGNI
jgi:hypothetical protein